jgi:DNA (cytosine-5)-methyltransferase 1
MDTILSIEEVSKRLKISAQQVRTYCREKAMLAQRVGRYRAIHESALKTFEISNTKDHPLKTSKNTRKPIALSFFSGAMGLDIGLEKAGFEILLACEMDKACRQTIQANKPNIALLGDLTNYSSEEILAAIGLTLGDEVDLIIGGVQLRNRQSIFF